MTPELLILTGDDQNDLKKLMRYMTPKEKQAVVSVYPELLGDFDWGSLISAVGTGVSSIVSNIQGRNSSSSSSSSNEIAAQTAILQAQARQSEQNQRMLMYAGIGAVALILLLPTLRRK